VYGVQVIWMPYRTAADLERAIDAFAAEPNGGLILLPPEAIRGTGFRLAAQYRLPAMYPDSAFANEGLMPYGSSFADIVRQSASLCRSHPARRQGERFAG
jgi:hypothetical protein